MQNIATTVAVWPGSSIRITRTVAIGSSSPQTVFRINSRKPAAISVSVCEIASSAPTMPIMSEVHVRTILPLFHSETRTQEDTRSIRTVRKRLRLSE